jgi:uncharacterized membrane protein YjfL (UPF0719 family)
VKSILLKILSSILATTLSLDLWFLLIYTLKISKIGFLQSMAVWLSHFNYLGWLIFAAFCIMLNVAFFKSIDSKHSQRLIKQGGNTVALLFVIAGMIVGLVGIGPLTFAIDKTRGWNPYGWWFPATFITTVVFGLIALLIYGYISQKVRNDQAE